MLRQIDEWCKVVFNSPALGEWGGSLLFGVDGPNNANLYWISPGENIMDFMNRDLIDSTNWR